MEDTCLIIFLKKQEVKIFQIKMKYKGRSQDRYRSDFLRKLLNGLFFKTSSPTFTMIMTRLAYHFKISAWWKDTFLFFLLIESNDHL